MTQSNYFSPEAIFLKALFKALDDGDVAYAVMRNYESLPYSVDGSDLDLLIKPDDKNRVKTIILNAIQTAGGVVLGISETIVFFKVFSFGKPESESKWWGLRLDINCGLKYGGVASLIDMDVLNNDCIYYRGVRVLKKNLAAVLGTLKEILYNNHLSERYQKATADSILNDWQNLSRQLSPIGSPALSLFRNIILTQPSHGTLARKSRKLRYILHLQAFLRSPRHYFKCRAAYIFSKIRRILHPPGSIIAVMGVDGSGKSTVINAIKDVLHKATHGSLYIKHLRPGLLPPLARLKGKTSVSAETVTNPHALKPSGMTGSIFRLLYLTTDYVLGYWILLRPIISKSPAIIIFDRYCYDIMIDPKRFRIGIGGWFVKWLIRMIPQPDIVLCLHASPNIIAERKLELPIEEVVRQSNELRNFSKNNLRVIPLSADGNVIDMKDKVLSKLANAYRAIHAGYFKRFSHN